MEYYVELIAILIFVLYSIIKSRSKEEKVPEFEPGRNLPPYGAEKGTSSDYSLEGIDDSSDTEFDDTEMDFLRGRDNAKKADLKIRQNQKTKFYEEEFARKKEFKRPSFNLNYFDLEKSNDESSPFDDFHNSYSLDRRSAKNQSLSTIMDRFNVKKAAFIYSEIFSKRKF